MKVLTKKVKDGKIIISSPLVSNIMLHGVGPKSEHIVKWNHSIGNQISESDMIRIARRVLRKTDKTRKLEGSLPKVLYTKDIDRRIIRFRAMLGSEYEEKRIIRFIIIEKLEPLYSIDDLGEFKSAVIDIILGIHYLAISEEGIKHRNITINSLMFRRTTNSKVQGVLSDWDSACNKDTKGEYNGDGIPVETRPFISKDLHIGRPSIYYERFDYESLFYSLYWISVFYSQGKSRPAREVSLAVKYWKKWNSYEDEDIFSAKTTFISSRMDENYLSSFFLPLFRSWLRPIRTLFLDGYYAKESYKTANSHPSQTVFNEETLGDHVTFERIYRILRQ